MVDQFNQVMLNMLDTFAPIVTKRITKKHIPWMSDLLRQLQRQRDRAYRKAKRSKLPQDCNVAFGTTHNNNFVMLKLDITIIPYQIHLNLQNVSGIK